MADVVYEESNGDDRPPSGSRHFGVLDVAFLDWAVLGAAGRKQQERVTVAGRAAGPHGQPGVLRRGRRRHRRGRRRASGFGLDQAFGASNRVSVDRVVMADYELAGLR